MNKLVPLNKFSKDNKKLSFLVNSSVVINNDDVPIGFVFGREAFITLLSRIDDQFEANVSDQNKAFDNWAGRMIDFIEEKLPVSNQFAVEVTSAIEKAEKEGWVSFKELKKSLNV